MFCGSTRPKSIDAARKSVAIRNAAGEKIVRYDRLIVAIGATPIRPNFPGGALDGVSCFTRWRTVLRFIGT